VAVRGTGSGQAAAQIAGALQEPVEVAGGGVSEGRRRAGNHRSRIIPRTTSTVGCEEVDQ